VRSTFLNRPNPEFRVLLRGLAASAWKLAKTSPRTLARTDLTASPWQRPVSHFRTHPAVSGEIQMAVIPHPPYSPHLAPCDFCLFPKMEETVGPVSTCGGGTTSRVMAADRLYGEFHASVRNILVIPSYIQE
jgi:hypothetical protein